MRTFSTGPQAHVSRCALRVDRRQVHVPAMVSLRLPTEIHRAPEAYEVEANVRSGDVTKKSDRPHHFALMGTGLIGPIETDALPRRQIKRQAGVGETARVIEQRPLAVGAGVGWAHRTGVSG